MCSRAIIPQRVTVHTSLPLTLSLFYSRAEKRALSAGLPLTAPPRRCGLVFSFPRHSMRPYGSAKRSQGDDDASSRPNLASARLQPYGGGLPPFCRRPRTFGARSRSTSPVRPAGGEAGASSRPAPASRSAPGVGRPFDGGSTHTKFDPHSTFAAPTPGICRFAEPLRDKSAGAARATPPRPSSATLGPPRVFGADLQKPDFGGPAWRTFGSGRSSPPPPEALSGSDSGGDSPPPLRRPASRPGRPFGSFPLAAEPAPAGPAPASAQRVPSFAAGHAAMRDRFFEPQPTSLGNRLRSTLPPARRPLFHSLADENAWELRRRCEHAATDAPRAGAARASRAP